MSSVLSSPVKMNTECKVEAQNQEPAATSDEANELKAQHIETTTLPRPSLLLTKTEFSDRTLKFETSASDKEPGEKTESDDKSSDESSIQVQFGWAEIGDGVVPYILRLNEKYCAVRMVESKLLKKYLNRFHQDIYNFVSIKSYYITEVESSLLNEINFKHSNGKYGKVTFTVKDLVVRLSDVTDFRQFLEVCYRKLILNDDTANDKCGFINIKDESIVPYIVRGGETFLPLFYFEDEIKNLNFKTDTIEGWDLSYLKFIFKLQRIGNKYIDDKICTVINLRDIKYYLPHINVVNSLPEHMINSKILLKKKVFKKVGHWTQIVVYPPRNSTTQISQPKAILGKSQVEGQVNTQQMEQPLHSSVAAVVVPTSNNVIDSAIIGGHQDEFSAISHHHTQPVLDMVAEQVDHAHQEQALAQTQAQHEQVHQQAQTEQAAIYETAIHNEAPASAKQYQLYDPNHATTTTIQSFQEPTDLDRIRSPESHAWTSSHEWSIDSTRKLIACLKKPYTIQKIFVDGIKVTAINRSPFIYTELIMTLDELQRHLFPSASEALCRKAFYVLGIKANNVNSTQLEILQDNGICSLHKVPILLPVKEVMDCMPHLKNIIKTLSENDQPNKRSRTSYNTWRKPTQEGELRDEDSC